MTICFKSFKKCLLFNVSILLSGFILRENLARFSTDSAEMIFIEELIVIAKHIRTHKENPIGI